MNHNTYINRMDETKPETPDVQGTDEDNGKDDPDITEVNKSLEKEDTNMAVGNNVKENEDTNDHKDDSNATDELQVEMLQVDMSAVERMSTATLGLVLPTLQKAKGTLNELLTNQEVLIETVQQENTKFQDTEALLRLKETMQQARVYHNKLISLKKEMTFLLDKSTKLKSRAVRLQQQRQREDLARAAQREKELEREQMLKPKIAQPSPPKTAQRSPAPT
ncbi:biogenesis of lysosome-related organelles complex 1 subunit 6-like isoform X2 [Dreissena polymorpha]|nr:biogenesis of lysosome-related organelles complex 1 subunit 6-like isoform X2 [Dreissena polymorpha]